MLYTGELIKMIINNLYCQRSKQNALRQAYLVLELNLRDAGSSLTDQSKSPLLGCSTSFSQHLSLK